MSLLESIENLFGQPAIEGLGWTLVHFLWQGTLVALVVSALLAAMTKAIAAARYLVACAGLLLMVACFGGTLAWFWSASSRTALVSVEQSGIESRAGTPAPADSVNRSAQGNTQSTSPPPIVPIPAGESSAASAEPFASPGTRFKLDELESLLPWFVSVWAIGVAVLSARLCVGWIAIQRMRTRRSRPLSADWEARLQRIAARLRVSRSVRAVESALVEVPALIGWLRPVILLPTSSLVGLAPWQLEAILAHELAHVRRHDYLVNLIQTVIETLLFYHPAVWWLSRAVRVEREACCDDIAAEVCGGRLEYARALASMEELRGREPRLVMAAGGASLVNRIRRLMGLPRARSNRSAWWVVAALAMGVLAMIAINGSNQLQADDPIAKSEKQATSENSEWGPESGGLRARLMAVSAETDDESPDVSKTTQSFARGEDVTVAVELKNVSDKAVTLLGVRYGDSYATAAGKLAAETFGPYLFEFELTDAAGKRIGRPTRVYLESMLRLSGASAHEIAPGKSLVVALRPTKFQSPMEYRFPPGNYKVRVRYRGPTEQALAQIKKHWPDLPQGKAWTGEAISSQIAFEVAADPKAPKPGALRWGETKNGLQAAVEMRADRGGDLPADQAGSVPLNTVLDPVFHLKNVGQEPISLVSETWRQGDGLSVKNEAGEAQKVQTARYSGWPVMIRWTLQPGEVAEIQAATVGVAADSESAEKFEHPVGNTLIVKPGTYTFRYTIRLGSIQSKDDKGNVVIPAKDDWQGELLTAEIPLVVRARTATDDAGERAKLFTGRIEFVGENGAPVGGGTFTARTAVQRGDAPAMTIRSGPNDVPDCSSRPLTIYVRAPGYEEAVFHDVVLKPNEVKRMELTPAEPTRFRLISSVDGKPVGGAKVRFFNKTSEKASSGPYPTDGLQGAVWAMSGADGTVTLDTLQKMDPYYTKLGDAVYFFYIEVPAGGLTNQFLGPVKAGSDLGEVKIGPPLEVRGEIRGTAEELERFAAEWDQPLDMKTASRTEPALYAVSKTLETKREGDKLTFHLTGLRQGKLRVISNFGPGPHSVSHIYGRRDPKGTDVVVEVDLKESLSGLVLTPTGQKAADERK